MTLSIACKSFFDHVTRVHGCPGRARCMLCMYHSLDFGNDENTYELMQDLPLPNLTLILFLLLESMCRIAYVGEVKEPLYECIFDDNHLSLSVNSCIVDSSLLPY